MEPVYLQDMLVPEERIAEMAKFREFAKNDTPEDLVIKTAWHETAHAIGWVLSGGALERATIIPNGNDHGVLWGSVHYEIDDEVVWTDEERQCSAFASLCAPAICELAGTPEPFETMNDIESAIEHLRLLYPAPSTRSTAPRPSSIQSQRA
jgi:hypothetical protein